MTGNSAEKNFCCVECKITSKTYIENVLLTRKTYSTSFALNSTTNAACFARIFLLIYRLELNL